jgi:hypothetical protein
MSPLQKSWYRIREVVFAGYTLLLFALAPGPIHAGQLPTAEFDIPYELRELPGGGVLEVSGSFSWALPQNLQAALSAAPNVRVIRLESPGGHVQAAMQVATIIRQRGLDTYVGRFCASACTLAFLAGRQRWLAPDARLGFHQAHAPGFQPSEANALLRQAYEQLGLAQSIIAHALRTEPSEVWVPAARDLRAADVVTGEAPADLVAIDDGKSRSLREMTRLFPAASDRLVVAFTTALAAFLTQLTAADAEACWAFAHDGAANLSSLLPPSALAPLAAVEQDIVESATTTAATQPSTEERKRTAAELLQRVGASGQATVFDGLRPGADHARFCPALHDLLQFVLGLPDPQRARDLRALLSSQ